MHISSEFDHMLGRAQALLVQMGAHVERQLQDALTCLAEDSPALIERVLRHEAVINELERSVDALAGRILALRKPAARDLRLVLAFIKLNTDLERIGDEAKKIVLRARTIGRPQHVELGTMTRLAVALVGEAVHALERLQVSDVAGAAAREERLDNALRGVLRELISHMIEDPRTISTCLDLVFVAKSLERVGDHATNILEHVVYATDGEHLRHAPPFSS